MPRKYVGPYSIKARNDAVSQGFDAMDDKLRLLRIQGIYLKKKHGKSKVFDHVRETRAELKKLRKMIEKWQKIALAPRRFVISDSMRAVADENVALRKLVNLRGLGTDKRIRESDLLSTFVSDGLDDLDVIRGASERPEPVTPQDRE